MPLSLNRLVALDTETHRIDRGELAPRLVCVSVHPAQAGAQLHHRMSPDTQQVVRNLLDLHRIVGHNVAFDMAVLAQQYPELLPLIFGAYQGRRVYDTLITERMLDIAEGRSLRAQRYDLGTLAQKYLAKDLDKGENSWRLRYGELDEVSLDAWEPEAMAYAIEDASSTMEVFRAQLQRAAGSGLPDDMLDDMPVQAYTAFCLYLVSCWGIHTDPEATERLRGETRKRLEQLRLALWFEDLIRWDAKKQQYVRRIKLARERMRATGSTLKTPKGNLSIGAIACKLCGDLGLEAFGAYGRTQSLLARLDTLAEGYVQPLQSTYVVPLETGRTSCRKPPKHGAVKGEQMQNINASVPGFRECFVPSAPDRCLLIADYGGLELATFAQAALVKVGFSKRAELINAGMDLHLYLAASELGASYDDILLRYRQGDPEVKVARARAKPANFGFLGGMGIAKYVLLCRDKYDMRIVEDDARKQKLAVVRAFPETAPYFEIVDRETKHGGLLRCIRSGRYRGGCGYTDGCNHYFQALGADLANDAVRRVTRACFEFDSGLYGSRLVAFIHDELLLDVPSAKYREAARQLKELMDAAAKTWLPDVRCTAEPIAAECWSKFARRVEDADGGLGIWDWREHAVR